jgi:hypothetical protein
MAPGVVFGCFPVKSAAKVWRFFELAKHLMQFFQKRSKKTKKTEEKPWAYLNFFVLLHAVL